MGVVISCFVDRKGALSLTDCANGNPHLEYLRLEFNFDLERRNIADFSEGHWPFATEQKDYKLVSEFFDQLVGTPEKLMEFAKTGHLSKASLTALLEPKIRKLFLSTCAIVEKSFTENCGASGSPCLEDGCAFEGTDETCLNAILLSEGKCLKVCVDLWVNEFKYPENRIEVWRK